MKDAPNRLSWNLIFSLFQNCILGTSFILRLDIPIADRQVVVMGKKSLIKGKVGEREAAAEIARLFNVEARRGCQFAGGPSSPDIVTEIAGVHFEVKRVELFRLYEALEQAQGDSAEHEVPVVLHRKNDQPWVAVVKLDDLPRLAAQLYLTLAGSS